MAVQTVIAQTGALKGTTRREDTVTQLIAAIRRVRRDVPGAADVVGQVTSAHDYDDSGKPRIAWNDQQARDTLVDALVRDALAVLAALGDQPPRPGGRCRRAAGVDRRAER